MEATPAPTEQTGPFLVLAGPGGVSTYDPLAGTLSNPETRVPLMPQDSPVVPSPVGGRVAYITGRNGIEDLSLNVLQVSSGRIDSVLLVPPENRPAPNASAGDPAAQAVRAIFENASIAWSPDGTRLAFVGLRDGPNADIYVVNVSELEKPAEDREILRLTSSMAHETEPTWSPDGRSIVYLAVERFDSGDGARLVGVRIARTDGSGQRLLYGPGGSQGETWLGWKDTRTLIAHSWKPTCGNENLREINIENGAAVELWKAPFNGAAVDPATGNLLVSVDYYTSNCPGGKPMGLYFILPGGSPVRLLGEEAFLPAWSPEAGLFFARTQSALVAVDPAGSVKAIEAPGPLLPSAGPSGALAWAPPGGIWIGSVEGAPRQIFEGNAALPAWGPDGGLYFLGEEGLYRFREDAAELVEAGATGSVAVWVVP